MSERERERGHCLLCVTAAAYGEEEDERSLPLRFLDIVLLLHSAFYSLWAVVVFPTIVGFPRYILCAVIATHCFVHCGFVLTSNIRLWPNEPW